MEKHSVARMIGAPPGYVGYEEGGYLTEAVRRRPYSLILLDEIEKAHADVFNILLQVLDDGRLTDGQGRTVDFRNTVLVMTSNLGSQAIQSLSEEGQSDRIKDTVMGIVGQHFRPEFINRVDDLIVFEPLSQDQIRMIAGLQLDALNARLQEQDLVLNLDEETLRHISEQGYDPTYGARPLKRAFQRLVEDPLANDLLNGRFERGQTLVGHWQGDGVGFEAQSVAA
jgi:ATP-dependent Clp protease ATP-binding subunit ClpB